MKKHTEIIQHYITKIKAASYLEVGVHPSRANFDRIVCPVKIGVDPDPEVTGIQHNITSDEFFAQNTEVFDLIFLDGLHYANQLETDICNASKCLAKHGVIICHDSNPQREEHTLIPRNGARIWNGDCYRAIVGLRKKYPGVKSYTYKEDHGVTVIWPKGQEFEGPFVSDISWEDFNKNKRRLLNLI
jgi:hypothetical protein